MKKSMREQTNENLNYSECLKNTSKTQNTLAIFLYYGTKQWEEFFVENIEYKLTTLTHLIEFINTVPQSNSAAH